MKNDTVSRQLVIDTLIPLPGIGRKAIDKIRDLPPAQPTIVPCNYAKACNEATMGKLTSAVLYYDVLEELRKHGYVLVDIKEVTT